MKLRFLPAFGSIATGIIYASIGVIAILSFLKIRHGGADEGSVFAIFNDYLLGKIVSGIILLGTLCYIIWRLYEAVKDPYRYGKDWKGIAKRTGIALSTVADILIVFAAVRVLLGVSQVRPDGQPEEERKMIGDLLQQDLGWLVVMIGIIYLTTAIVQFFYGVTRGYRERVNIERFSSLLKHVTNLLAWLGYFGRGVVLGITGFFLVKAGVEENSRNVVNTDKAFDFIGDHVGHMYFIFIALCTICYGLFLFVQGLAYDTDKD